MRIGNQENEIGTVVGANVRLQGTLKDSNDITVHGTVEGEVISERAVNITETAMIKGPITAEVVTIAGNVKGSVDAKNKIEILATGQIQGSITTSNLIIHAGAHFNGKSTMPEGSGDTKPISIEGESETKKTESATPKASTKEKSDTEFELE